MAIPDIFKCGMVVISRANCIHETLSEDPSVIFEINHAVSRYSMTYGEIDVKFILTANMETCTFPYMIAVV